MAKEERVHTTRRAARSIALAKTVVGETDTISPGTNKATVKRDVVNEERVHMTRRSARSSALAKNIMKETDTSSPCTNEATVNPALVKEERPQITRRTVRSSALAKTVVEETDTIFPGTNKATVNPDMDKEERPQITKRAIRSSTLAKTVVKETDTIIPCTNKATVNPALVKEERPQITKRAVRSSALAKTVVEETDTIIPCTNKATVNPDMDKEERPQITKRAIRSSTLAKTVVKETDTIIPCTNKATVNPNMDKEERPQITKRAIRSSTLAETVKETDTIIPCANKATVSTDMVRKKSPQITRRSTRTSSLTKCSNSVVEKRKASSQPKLTVDDLLIGEEGEFLSFSDLMSSFPGRDSQIKELLSILGPQNSPMLPVFIYGGPSTGKTSIVLQTFRHLKRPIVYSSCLTCYTPRVLFESILNQLFLHRKNSENDYSSAKRCEKPSDFVNFLREALVSIIGNLQGKSSGKANGSMIYLIFDNVERVKGWDKGSTLLPLLFNLCDTLKMSEVGLIFISNTSPDTYDSNMGYVEPNPLYFPDYSDDELGEILMRNQANKKLYTSFLSVVLRPFSRITRRVDELSSAFSLLFRKYCEPITDLGVVPNEEMKRKLFSRFQPHIAPSLNEIFKVSTPPSTECESTERKPKASTRKSGSSDVVEQLDFHMSTSAKYLLISAFLASRNPATLDASLFDSTGGLNNRKRKRKVSEKSMEQKETAEQELLMKGPGTFPMERLLAIFQCITSVAENPLDDEEQVQDGIEIPERESGLMSDVLLQLNCLCCANFIVKGGSCPLEGSARFRSTVSEDMALQVARSIKFPLSKYLYRR